jgi:hypothetical protein
VWLKLFPNPCDNSLRQEQTDIASIAKAPNHSRARRFSIEHIQPRAIGGLTIAENLALACQGCNGHKSTKTTAIDHDTQTSAPIFHPRQQNWQEHFAWSEDRLNIIRLTPTGRATISLLHLNRASLLNLRRALLAVNSHPTSKG